jgi:hypothetical protein
MGVDFISKAAPSFKKALDRRAVELRTPTLFSRDIPLVARTASADICKGSAFAVGESLLLRIIDNRVIAQRGNLVVANFTKPPDEFLNQIQSGAGVALGRVTAIHTLSEKVEIGFCEQ